MNNKTYYLLRHGETFATKNRIDYGDEIFTAPILEEGKIVLERIADYFKNITTDLNISSPYLRCKQTAEIIEKRTDKKFIFDDRLGEFYNETFDHFKDRVLNFIKEMESSEYKNILIVAHGGCISGISNYLLSNYFNEEELPNYPNPGELLIIKDNKSQLLDFN